MSEEEKRKKRDTDKNQDKSGEQISKAEEKTAAVKICWNLYFYCVSCCCGRSTA